MGHDDNSIRLTQMSKRGGCAAKLPAASLTKALSQVRFTPRSELLVGSDTLDDAALFELGDGRLLIQTVDFFTPIVDDPATFGAIAAANALSDVYAMGGAPATALTVLGFPSEQLPLDQLAPLLRGAVERIEAAGACVAGGHSIESESLILGFSVSGFVDAGAQWSNAGAQAGDALILTKGLGTGTITSALKSGEADAEAVEAAIAGMVQLNDAPPLLSDFDVHAATDVTGYGLAGHAMQLARASKVSAVIDTAVLPVLPGAEALLERGVLNRAHRSNELYASAEHRVTWDDAVTAARRWLTLDPQTSGPLLLSVPAAQAEDVLAALRPRFGSAVRVGTVEAPGDAPLRFT